jgi:ribosomal-protein-alanine N-acetyltransferase
MLEISFQPFPVIETERLILRELLVEDKEVMFELRTDANIMRYIPRPPLHSIDDAIALIEKMQLGMANLVSLNWAISLKDSPKMIGSIALINIKKEHHRTEIGYMMHPAFHRKGMMQEALKAVIQYAFTDLNFHSIEAVIDPENIASENLLLQNKFIKEAHFKEDFFFQGRFLDSVIYSLLNPKH